VGEIRVGRKRYMMNQEKRYASIKELVFDVVRRSKGSVDYQTVTSHVRSAFPKSKWDKTHWAWYRNQMTRGRFKDLFTEEVRRNLQITTKQLEGKGTENRVKHFGDAILKHARSVINAECGEEQDFRFKVNRWVYSRLQQDEIRVKRPIKKHLWNSGIRSCQGCGKDFDSLKGVEIHRKDSRRNYSKDNCLLLCRPCQELTT
jgi:hypothetical protein